MSPHTLEVPTGPSDDQAGAIRMKTEPDRGTGIEALQPAPTGGTTGPSSVLEPDWSGRSTVLVADDDEAVAAVAAAMLEHLGFSVVRVNDGREALAAYAEHAGEFAFLLIDLTMQMGGEDVLDELERMGSTTPIVLFSGYSTEELSQRLSGRRVATFLQKPFELCDLLAAAHQAVESLQAADRTGP